MKSKKFRLNWLDAVKGCLVASISAGITVLYTALNNGGIPDWNQILNVSIIAGLGYIIKNFFES